MDIIKAVDKLNKPRAFELGDRVIHKLTQRCGRVVDIQRIGDTNQMLSVELYDGRIMRGLRGSEFGLNTSVSYALDSPKVSTDAVERFNAARAAEQPDASAPSLAGPISDRSILDELV